ncbi:MAG: ABC transporter ATP-binding protein, partial [Acidimicrobiales bacterium]
DEAEALADRVVIMQAGRVVAEGPPGELGGLRAGASHIVFRLTDGELPAAIAARAVRSGERVELLSTSPVVDLAELCGWAVGAGVELADLQVTRPSLEDVYLELTGAA